MFDPVKEQQKLMETWSENMKKFTEMFPVMDDYTKLWEVKIPGLEMYNRLFDFYKGIVNPEDLTKNLQENYNRVMSAFLKNAMPNADVATFFEEPQQLIETCIRFYRNMMEPWMQLDEELVKKVLKGDDDAVISFFNEINDKYETTFGKVVKMMHLGINMESANQQQEVVDAYYKMMFSAGKLSAIMTKSNKANVKNLMERYQDMMKEGQKVSTFREFYDLWYHTSEKALEDLFATDAFSKAFADFTDTYFLYLTASNKVLEKNLSKLPIPTNKDMDGLYKTVYDLRKDVHNLKKEMEGLKSAQTAKASKTSKTAKAEK